jgi:hypothetical protein
VEALIYEQKWPVVADMFHLLQVTPQRFQEVRPHAPGHLCMTHMHAGSRGMSK